MRRENRKTAALMIVITIIGVLYLLLTTNGVI